ncbi:23S rRNA (uracil(1939)-C(5))-methyltransferase RlmD [Hutsoniella sourekii]
MHLKKNQVHQGQVIDLNSKGAGVVKIDHYPVFIEGIIPGETVEFKLTKVNKKYGFGRLLKILVASPHRVEVKDPIGRQIGTMTLQHMDYAAQLVYKHSQVEQVFQRIGGFKDIEVRPVIGMDHPWEYRNKAQVPVREVKGQLETGFYRRGSHELVPVENFHIQYASIDQTLVTLRDILRKYQIQPYNEENQSGLVRHIVVKQGHYTKQVMVVLVVNGSSLPNEEKVISEIVDQVPNLVSLVLNSNQRNTNVILGPDNRTLWGQDYYQDQMLGLDLMVSVHSFYQVNTPQAERLYQEAIQAADLQGKETVLDAYCGIGSITLAVARHAREVYGMEVVSDAIEMARENAELNQINNAHFTVGKAEEVLPKWQEVGLKFDVAVIDPPRKGLDPDFVETLIQLDPQRIVYVSCNPATCARDCQLFAQAGYQVQYVQPVDLFPQTVHVEACVLLTKSQA